MLYTIYHILKTDKKCVTVTDTCINIFSGDWYWYFHWWL